MTAAQISAARYAARQRDAAHAITDTAERERALAGVYQPWTGPDAEASVQMAERGWS